MGKKSIPRRRPGNSRNRTRCSRPCGQSWGRQGEEVRSARPVGLDLRFTIYDLRPGQEHESLASRPEYLGKRSTSNIQHPTSNVLSAKPWALDVECWMLDVFWTSPNRKSPIVNHKFCGRVMGAWWPSRSSKPLSVRFTGRGVFDSLPLRQDQGR